MPPDYDDWVREQKQQWEAEVDGTPLEPVPSLRRSDAAPLRNGRWATHRLSYHAAVRQLLYFRRVGRWMDRVGEASIGKIPGFPYTAPFEDITIKSA